MNEMNNKNNNQNGGEHKGMMKHGLGMMLCCLLPILLIAAVPLLGIKGGGAASFLPYLVFLACPLGMVFMMFSMRGKNNNGGSVHGGMGHSVHAGHNAGQMEGSKDISLGTVQDPVCGMYVSKHDAISREIDGKTYYFCSGNCVDEFEKRRAIK